MEQNRATESVIVSGGFYTVVTVQIDVFESRIIDERHFATEEEAKVPQSANANEQKEKRHRRSKNDPIGRKYICNLCSKSYLSAPALSSHRKTKHFQNEEKKGRGRPRKYVSVLY